MRTINQEWLNQNAGRAYPFREDASRSPVGMPDIVIPNYLLVDMTFTITHDAAQIYLSYLRVSDDVVDLRFGLVGTGEVVISTLIDVRNHTPNTGYRITGEHPWSDAQGWITLGDLTNLTDDIPSGAYTFESPATTVESRIVRPSLRGVRSLSVDNRGDVSPMMFGDVKLIGGQNVRLEYDYEDNAVIIHVDPNAGYRQDCPCDDVVDAIEQRVVRTINGIAVEHVEIVGDGRCIDVVTSGNTIRLEDRCSTPCCGCPELDFIYDAVNRIDRTISSLENYAFNLEAKVANLGTILGVKH